MLEYMPVAGEALFQHGLTIVLVSAPQDMIVRAGDDADRVELDKTKAETESLRLRQLDFIEAAQITRI